MKARKMRKITWAALAMCILMCLLGWIEFAWGGGFFALGASAFWGVGAFLNGRKLHYMSHHPR